MRIGSLETEGSSSHLASFPFPNAFYGLVTRWIREINLKRSVCQVDSFHRFVFYSSRDFGKTLASPLFDLSFHYPLPFLPFHPKTLLLAELSR